MSEILEVDGFIGGDDLTDTDGGAEILGIAPVTLKNSRYTGMLGHSPAPEFLKIGKNVRYSKNYLKRKFLPSCRVVPSPEPIEAT